METEYSKKAQEHIRECIERKWRISDVLSGIAEKFSNEGMKIIKDRIIKDTSLLHLVVENKQIDNLKFFLENGANVNTPNSKGYTALHIAVDKGSLDCVKELLGKNAKTDFENVNSPIYLAVNKENLKIVNTLIKLGAKIDIENKNGNTPLILAIKKGNLAIVDALIEAGASIDKIYKDEKTPLILAIEAENIEIIEKILKTIISKRKQPLEGSKFTDKEIDCIIEHKIFYAIRSDDLKNSLELKNINVNTKNKEGNSLLHIAVSNSNIEDVKILLKNNADIEIKNNNEETPVYIALKKNNIEILKLFIEKYGTNVFKIQDKKGNTPLHFAFKNLEIMRFLFEEIKKFDKENIESIVDIRNNNGITPLYIATQNRDIENVEELLRLDASSLPDHNGTTPVHIAASKGNISILDLFANKFGADCFKDQTKKGSTPLHIAIDNGDFEATVAMFEEIIGLDDEYRKAIVDIANNDKETPLHFAVISEDEVTVQALIDIGASLELKNNKGQTAFDIAKNYKSSNIIKIFKELEKDRSWTEKENDRNNASNKSTNICNYLYN